MKHWIGLLSLLGALGCEQATKPSAGTACKQLGDQCKLPKGPLGVCNPVPCAPGAQAPCLACTSQH
jgi:hypothetical protein